MSETKSGMYPVEFEPTNIEAYTIFLAEMVRLASSDAKQALELLDDIETTLAPGAFRPLRFVVMWYAMDMEDAQNLGNMESALYPIFTEKHAELIPGSVIVPRPRMGGHAPDFMVEVGGRVGPVEIKRGNFDVAAVRQLQRYMEVSGADIGYAVAPALTATLPDHMRFVEINFPAS
jgi:hypothetical protein